MMLVSLEKTKEQLKITWDDEDSFLIFLIRASSMAIVNYLKDQSSEFLDSNGEVEIDSNDEPVGVPPDIQLACLFLVGYYHGHRGDDEQQFSLSAVALPRPVMALLNMRRVPTLA